MPVRLVSDDSPSCANCCFLAHRGISIVMTLAEHGLVGKRFATVDLGCFADTVIVLHFYEHAGAVRKGNSVMKKRAGSHEDTIRELWMESRRGLDGEPARAFQNAPTGDPTFVGPRNEMHGTVDAIRAA